jgi:hypothetical protein
MPPDIVKEREVFDLLTENHIDFIRIDSLGNGDSQSLQFFTGKTSKSLCSASQSSLFGLGYAQSQLSDMVFATPSDFRPVLLFSANFSLLLDKAMRQLGVSVANLIATLAESKLNTGLYHVSGFTCVATCAKWLDLICQNRSNLVQPDVLYFSRLITPTDFALWQGKLAKSSEPWELLDTLLEERKKPGGDWTSSLSLSDARAVLEAAKGGILKEAYAQAVSALVLDYDRRVLELSSSPSLEKAVAHRNESLREIQAVLDCAVGKKGRTFLQFAKKITKVLEDGKLVLKDRLSTGEFFRLRAHESIVELESLVSGKKTRVTSLPPVEVVSAATVNDQRLTNALSHATIGLEEINQVSKYTFEEFVKYFDRVHEHVGNKDLIKQFQKWLDSFPDEFRDFDEDVEAKRIFARAINERAKILGCRFVCPVDGCGVACGLSVVMTGSSKSGQFVFKHKSGDNYIPHLKATILPKKLRLAPRTHTSP